ncbi:MAG TPA: SDR family oxidoreductase [Acidobacteriaceae bacterium]|jgi:NAD(P)-dependent dehydrogenase (short-subunit alcohol dehydrogenase family)|nr:SDR family oxidoreductase [Acidobacteriaceae bacterium]
MQPRDVPASTTASPLAGRTALITGASRGIGRAVAFRLAQLGARLLLVARDQKALAEVRREIVDLANAEAEELPCDLTSASEIQTLSSRIDQAGGCDVLVNSAGIGRIGAPLHEIPLQDFDAVIATNLRAPFLLMRAVIPHMIARRAGDIVNISSLAGQGPLADGAAYAASKWALNGLSYSAAEELRSHNIRVSVVAPGSVNTDFGRGGKDRTKMLQPDDVAATVAMLVTQPRHAFISEVRMRPTQKP